MLLQKYEKYLYDIIDQISNEKDKGRIIEAYNIAKNAHDGQKRKSGEEYITHPLAVGFSLWKKFEDIDLLISGLLHDTVEDCDGIDMEFIYNKFGENIGFIVDSVTKTEKKFLGDNKKFDDERDKMLYGGMKNIGCILVKLADRDHNLATLGFMPKHKQVKKSFESQAIYLPLMNILNFNKEGISIEKSKKCFLKYLKDNDISTCKELKNKLFNVCFNDFTEEIFDIVYNNSTNVLWVLKDEYIFENLVQTNIFNNNTIDLISLKGDTFGYFKAVFKVKPGVTFQEIKKIKLYKNIFIT